MLAKKKKSRPPFALSFMVYGLVWSARMIAMANKKKNKSISLVDLAEVGAVSSGSSIRATISSLISSLSAPRSATVVNFGSLSSIPPLVEVYIPHLVEALNPSSGSITVTGDAKTSVDVDTQSKNYAALLKSSAQLQEMGSPSEHISDESIEAAKLEFKDLIYTSFHGDYPSMGKIIGVVNVVWARTGPRIFIHNIWQVTNPKTREVLLSRTCWNIVGLPMFVAPWCPEYSPKEPPLTSVIVAVEMQNFPYMLFNKEILSRLATAMGKPASLFPETKRKKRFDVPKLYVRVDLTAPLPHKIISCFFNGKEVQIDISYPWLPVNCDLFKKFGHKKEKCSVGVYGGSLEQSNDGAPESNKNEDASSKTLQENNDLEEGEIAQEVVEITRLRVNAAEQHSESVQIGVVGTVDMPATKVPLEKMAPAFIELPPVS
ncbi:hypothetical protein N665_0583s0007 [Sinapis alba]|nr:hypothetical protein N665_0583s0007 [Sinapis alba]